MAKPDRLLEAFIDLRDRIVNVVLRIAPPQDVEDIVQETIVTEKLLFRITNAV